MKTIFFTLRPPLSLGTEFTESAPHDEVLYSLGFQVGKAVPWTVTEEERNRIKDRSKKRVITKERKDEDEGTKK